MMHGMPSNLFNQRGQISQQGMMRLATGQMQFGLSGGPNDVVGPQGITPKPIEVEACFAFVDDFMGNVHAWTEANVSDPANPIRMEGGRFGRILSSSSDTSSDNVDDNEHWAAYDFNGKSHDVGTLVYIIRVTWNAWGIICCAESDTSSDGFCFEVDCEAGTIIVTDCGSSSTITTTPSGSTSSDTNTILGKGGGGPGLGEFTDPGTP